MPEHAADIQSTISNPISNRNTRAMPQATGEQLLTREDVMSKVRVKYTSIVRYMAESDFPRPVLVGERAVRWIESEIDAWIANRPRSGA